MFRTDSRLYMCTCVETHTHTHTHTHTITKTQCASALHGACSHVLDPSTCTNPSRQPPRPTELTLCHGPRQVVSAPLRDSVHTCTAEREAPVCPVFVHLTNWSSQMRQPKGRVQSGPGAER